MPAAQIDNGARTASPGALPPMAERVWRRVTDDPGKAALRRAARAALVQPAAFAFAKLIIGDVQTVTFVAFGCFGLIVMADFGGPRRDRAVAYLTTVLIGAVLISLATLCSSSAWPAVLGMLLVGFSIQFAGVFGGYVAAAQTVLQLSFLLAVTIPGPASVIGARLTGWLLAGLVSTLAGVFLWPRFEQVTLHQEAARACRSLAELIAAFRTQPVSAEVSRRHQTAQAAIAKVEHDYAATPKRPAGPGRRDRAFVELLTDLQPALDFATQPARRDAAPPSPARPCITEGDELAAATVQVLDGSADVLVGGAAPDLLALQRVRLTHREALDRWAGEALQSGTSPEDVLVGLDVDHWLRVASYLALAIGSNAVIAAGKRLDADLQLPAGTPLPGRTRPLLRIARTVRTHLSPTSSVLHQSLRVGLGLAIAVFLARALALSHAFWVVLGTLSVLRSNALGTGRTTVEALAGTAAGFVVGALFTVLFGGNSIALWVSLPIIVFLATYAAGAIGFVVGQAAFTVLVIILFNVISPVGWLVGLARIEDVALGVGISLVVGVLLWPRGARGELLTTVADLYRAAAAFLSSSFAYLLESPPQRRLGSERRMAVEARDRAEEALGVYMNERGAKPFSPEAAAFLVSAGTRTILACDLLAVVEHMGYQARNSSDAAPLRTQTQLLLARYLWLADRLDGTSGALLPEVTVSDSALHQAALSALRHWQEDPAGHRAAMTIVIAAEWIQQLDALTSALKDPVDRAAESARVPWWR